MTSFDTTALTAETGSDSIAAERDARLAAAATAWSDRIDADRSASHLTFTVRGAAEGAVATRLTSGAHTWWVDEPAALAGDDIAPSPVEYALGALISCQVVVFHLYAKALGIPFDDIRITAQGDLDAARLLGKDEAVRAGFSEIRVEIRISGPESDERYEHLREVVDAHCPVLDLFANATPVTSRITRA